MFQLVSLAIFLDCQLLARDPKFRIPSMAILPTACQSALYGHDKLTISTPCWKSFHLEAKVAYLERVSAGAVVRKQ
jgi:hypothetical protein